MLGGFELLSLYRLKYLQLLRSQGKDGVEGVEPGEVYGVFAGILRRLFRTNLHHFPDDIVKPDDQRGLVSADNLVLLKTSQYLLVFCLFGLVEVGYEMRNVPP